MIERRRYVYTWDDDGPDSQGRRRFTLYWQSPDGTRHAQSFHADPTKHISNGRRMLGGAICTFRRVRDADQAWSQLARLAQHKPRKRSTS